jgi:Bacterial Ig-like domain (group 3)
MTATVAPASGSGTPTGAVAFFMGATQLGMSALQSGVATFDYNPSTLVVDSYEFTASYVGDATYATSTSSAQTLTVSSPPHAAMPTFSAAAGSYGSPQTYDLRYDIGGTVFYTNDGTHPRPPLPCTTVRSPSTPRRLSRLLQQQLYQQRRRQRDLHDYPESRLSPFGESCHALDRCWTKRDCYFYPNTPKRIQFGGDGRRALLFWGHGRIRTFPFMPSSWPASESCLFSPIIN